jgi:hypothetical protein
MREEDVSNLAPGEGPRGREGMFAPPKLLWRSIMASLQGLHAGAGGPPVGQDKLAQLPHLQPGALFCCGPSVLSCALAGLP